MDFYFTMGQIGRNPEVKSLVDMYRREMTRRRLPTYWSNNDAFHQGSLIFNGEPMSMVMFAPLESRRHVIVTGAMTLPSWRRCGLYSHVIKLCVNQWRLEGSYDWLLGGFHENNWISRDMQISQGCEIYQQMGDSYRTRLSLRPTGEEFQIESSHLAGTLANILRLKGQA